MRSISSSAVNSLEKFGDVGQFALPILSGLYVLGTGHPVQAIALGVLGYAQSYEVAALKRIFPRETPKPYFHGQRSPEDIESFPSGHTGGAFLAFGFAAGLYGTTNPLTITFLALACLVGASRYASEKHWPSDIVVGALIGTLNGWLSGNCSF